MNPRIQVEHTVTEEVTDVDLVQAQLRIAVRRDAWPTWGSPRTRSVLRGAALQCRITTEDPANGFRPDTGQITTYRSPGGGGVRLDGGTVYTGAEVSAHFDSMLAKLTCRGRTFDKAVEKARRAVAEFRIRGVATNIPFLQAVLDDPDFAAGRVTTSFIETHPAAAVGARLGRPRHQAADLPRRGDRQPAARPRAGQPRPGPQAATDRPRGARARRQPPGLLRLGPEELRATAARAARGGRHRHHLPRRPPVAAGHPGAHPRPARRRAARRPHHPRAVVPGVLGRGDVRRGAALPLRGPLGAAGRAAPGRAQRVPADAAARAQHRRLHALPDRRSPTRSSPRRPPPGSTSSASSTPSTTSSRCVRRSRRCGPPARPWPRWRCATPATSPIPASSSTPSTTTCAWPSGSSRRAPTCWRSRTWPACCAPQRRAPWSPPCASASTCRCTCTPTTPPAASWPP